MSRGKLFTVGIGPGSLNEMTPHANEAIAKSDIVIGYKTYIDLIKPLLTNKEVLSNGMMQEIERCNSAIDQAAAGKTVAVISSGDAGIYGMAGLLMELLERRGINLPIEVIPGVTAANAAAARLGAPLMNDFAVISLSDLMIPSEVIRQRLKAIAGADMVCVLYNPRSKKRRNLFEFSLQTFSEARGNEGCMGFVKNATRENEIIWRGTFATCPVDEIDMTTVVLMGNSNTERVNGHLLTRRGYTGKKTFPEKS